MLTWWFWWPIWSWWQRWQVLKWWLMLTEFDSSYVAIGWWCWQQSMVSWNFEWPNSLNHFCWHWWQSWSIWHQNIRWFFKKISMQSSAEHWRPTLFVGCEYNVSFKIQFGFESTSNFASRCLTFAWKLEYSAMSLEKRADIFSMVKSEREEEWRPTMAVEKLPHYFLSNLLVSWNLDTLMSLSWILEFLMIQSSN